MTDKQKEYLKEKLFVAPMVGYPLEDLDGYLEWFPYDFDFPHEKFYIVRQAASLKKVSQKVLFKFVMNCYRDYVENGIDSKIRVVRQSEKIGKFYFRINLLKNNRFAHIYVHDIHNNGQVARERRGIITVAFPEELKW